MAGITTAFVTSMKSDMFSGLHCFNATTTFTATGTSTQTWTAVSSLTGLAVGMALSGTNVAANTVIDRIISSTSIHVSVATTGALGTVTATGDSFKIALIKISMTGTYGAATTNYTDVTGNSDEVSGTGYSAGGTALTNVSPTTSGTTGFVDFSPDPSWTSASFSTAGCILYNNTQRGPVATRALSVHDFGGTQTVTSGTFTAVFPTPDASNAILRLS